MVNDEKGFGISSIGNVVTPKKKEATVASPRALLLNAVELAFLRRARRYWS